MFKFYSNVANTFYLKSLHGINSRILRWLSHPILVTSKQSNKLQRLQELLGGLNIMAHVFHSSIYQSQELEIKLVLIKEFGKRFRMHK